MEVAMRLASTVSVVVLSLGLAVPACAGGRAEFFPGSDPLPDPGILLQGLVREDDVSLLFAQLRAALLASYQGREAPSSGELDRRMEAIAAEVKARGAIAGLALLAALEAAARQAVRDAAPVSAPR
jgi:hypothetical protein